MKNQLAELRALDRARAQYENEGFVVTMDERLPSPFEGFVADAVARRGNETVIIEIRSSDMSDNTRNRFGRLSSIVRAQEGWRVDVITFEPDAALPNPDAGDVVRRIEEARLVSDLSPDAAVMLTWSAVEGALLELHSLQDVPRRSLPSSRRLIREMVIDGLLSDAQADGLDKLAQIRNYITHGLSAPSIDQDELDWAARFALAATEGQVATIENMIEWFRENYEPPDVAGLPYDSEDDQYIWFDRGPHDVDDVLREHFSGALESDVQKAADILGFEGGIEWAKRAGV